MSEPTFTLATDGKAITCHKCGLTSHNPSDVAFHYCGKCNLWHDGPNLLNAADEAALFEFTEAVGKLIRRQWPQVQFFLTMNQKPEFFRPGIDKFGVSIVTNLGKDDLLKLLRGIVANAGSDDDLPGVTVRVE